jgi:hypothetical protein
VFFHVESKMTHMDKLLSSVFYRRACPPAETLGDYHLGRLAAGQRLATALHLRECPHCAAELALYAASAQERRKSPAEALAAAQRDLAGLVDRVLWATLTPRAQPILRGSGAPPQVFSAEGLQVTLEVQPALTGYRRRRLVGKVEPAGGVVGVDLWMRDTLLDSRLADETGFFAFDRLTPGLYLLSMRKKGVEVWIETAVGEG